QEAGIVDMFGILESPDEVKAIPDVPAWDEKTRLMNEKESLGLFLTGHPIDLYKKELRQIISVNLGQWLQKLDTSDSPTSGYRRKDENAIVIGLVIGIRTRNAPAGREVFVTLDDRTGRIDVRVFPEMFQEIEEIVKKDLMWVVEGGISYDDFNNGIRIRARKVELLETFRLNHAKSVKINLLKSKSSSIQNLGRELQTYRSDNALPLVFHNEKEGYEYLLQTDNWRLLPSDESLLILEKHLGKDAFYIDYS
ncbi:MAG: hypothetical protein KAU21_04425, partial [Gammaproteobacteria bacterium]|nr:hypothetical protein [Gammaproteobacteria bacterium]